MKVSSTDLKPSSINFDQTPVHKIESLINDVATMKRFIKATIKIQAFARMH